MGTDILTEIRAAGITLSVDGGNLVATPKAAITDELRALIRAHTPAILAALAPIAEARAPVNLDELLAAACQDLAGITPAQFRALLAPEDIEDIADLPVETLHGYAESFAEGLRLGADRRSGRVARATMLRVR